MSKLLKLPRGNNKVPTRSTMCSGRYPVWGRKEKDGIDDPQTSTVEITQGAHAVDHVFGEVRDGDAVGETDGESEVAAVGLSVGLNVGMRVGPLVRPSKFSPPVEKINKRCLNSSTHREPTTTNTGRPSRFTPPVEKINKRCPQSSLHGWNDHERMGSLSVRK